MAGKPKLSVYWAAACGGCEIAVVNLHEKILDVDAVFDFFFCPCLLDTKKKDIEALPEDGIAITLFNGAIRTSENEEMAKLLREKSQIMVAFGSCASEGCIPGLANLHSRDDLLRDIYIDNPTVDNPGGVLPSPRVKVPEGELELPELYEKVKTLSQVTDVDYYIPGCPPESHQIWNVLSAIIEGKELPPKGSVIGAGNTAVCQECKREKSEKKVKRLYRNYEIIPDEKTCLLEQGIICMGIATRDGCGALCPEVNMPCTGCYGPPEGVRDQGAKMVAALGSIMDMGETKGMDEKALAGRIEEFMQSLPDQAGTFYKYSLPGSILGGKKL